MVFPDFTGLHVQCHCVLRAKLPLDKAGRPSLGDGIKHVINGLIAFRRRKPNLALAAIGCNADQMDVLHVLLKRARVLWFLSVRRELGTFLDRTGEAAE